MTDAVSLASTGLAFFLVAVSPGPATISNATIAMSHGRKISLIYGTGLSFGLVFWGVIAASGMGAVLQGSVYLLMTLKVVGGLYLLWLSLLVGREAWNNKPESKINMGERRWFLHGLLLNMSNPKSVIAWIAALSVGLDNNAGVDSVIAATVVCIAVGFIVNAMYSFVFSIAGMMKRYQRFRRVINTVVAGLFAVAGLGLIGSSFSR